MIEGLEGTVGNDPRWWAEWFEADYSWDGLAKRKIRGGGAYGEQTLQDYWRRDPATGQQRNDTALREAGELVEFGGRWWHIVHLPLCDDTGEVGSLKAGLAHPIWTQLKVLVVKRLAAAREAAGIFAGAGWISEGRDGRAQFDGGVLGQGMALAAVFKPFSTLGDAVTGKTAHPSFVAALMAVNPAVAMGVRLATTIQSLLSGVLIFLFALAVKRRFQIS